MSALIEVMLQFYTKILKIKPVLTINKSHCWVLVHLARIYNIRSLLIPNYILEGRKPTLKYHVLVMQHKIATDWCHAHAHECFSSTYTASG